MRHGKMGARGNRHFASGIHYSDTSDVVFDERERSQGGEQGILFCDQKNPLGVNVGPLSSPGNGVIDGVRQVFGGLVRGGRF